MPGFGPRTQVLSLYLYPTECPELNDFVPFVCANERICPYRLFAQMRAPTIEFSLSQNMGGLISPPQIVPVTSHGDEAAVGWFPSAHMLGGTPCALVKPAKQSLLPSPHPGTPDHILSTLFGLWESAFVISKKMSLCANVHTDNGTTFACEVRGLGSTPRPPPCWSAWRSRSASPPPRRPSSASSPATPRAAWSPAPGLPGRPLAPRTPSIPGWRWVWTW